MPRLISRGLTPAQAARAPGVPMPLVTLIAVEESGIPIPSPKPTAARGGGAKTQPGLLFIAAITAGCAGSILGHEPLLPIVLVTAGFLAGNSLREQLPAAVAGTRHGPEPVR